LSEYASNSRAMGPSSAHSARYLLVTSARGSQSFNTGEAVDPPVNDYDAVHPVLLPDDQMDRIVWGCGHGRTLRTARQLGDPTGKTPSTRPAGWLASTDRHVAVEPAEHAVHSPCRGWSFLLRSIGSPRKHQQS